MRRNAVHIECPQTGRAQHPLHHQQRQVGIVFVRDRIELHLLDQVQQMGKFERHDTVRVIAHPGVAVGRRSPDAAASVGM